MKNILVYINPAKKFDEEHSVLIKLQIDNNLDLGWKKENILLATNFNYEYRGVKSLVVGDDLYFEPDKTSIKIPVITHLLNQGTLEKGILYWYHDLDVHQLNIVEETELGLENFDLGLTPYAYKTYINKPQWQCGSFFFKESAKDIFNQLNDYMNYKREKNRCDEKCLLKLTAYNAISEQRYKVLNHTYNFTYKYIDFCYKKAIKPLKALHFHPWLIDEQAYDPRVLNVMMYRKNRPEILLMTERLIKLFKQYGIK